MMDHIQKNWAGNYTYQAARWHFPETVEEVQEIVKRCDKVKVVGTRHSFNNIADCAEDLVSLVKLAPMMVLDREHKQVTVSAHVTYGQLCYYLFEQGMALHNLASLPHISLVGACATATHGSGNKNGNLATAVSAMHVVTADGTLLKLSRQQDGELFAGMVVGLGGLGIITQLTLDVVPTFDIQQVVYHNLPLSRLETHFEDIMSLAYSVSLFTNWQDKIFNQVWVKQQVTDNVSTTFEPMLFEAIIATDECHPVPGHAAKNCTKQMAVPGPWHKRLPHFHPDFTPSSGKELQTEYFLPRHHAFPALLALSHLHKQLAPLLLISEVRTIAADDLWLSPCYEQDCVAIHFTWHPNWPQVSKLLPIIEKTLAPFQARPHWGKLFTMSPTHLQALYKKLPDFQQLLQRYDPKGKFRNQFLKTYIFGRSDA